MRRGQQLAIGLLALGVAGAGGFWLVQGGILGSRAREEATTMAPALAECRARLAELHAAWARYRAEHKGAEPPTLDALVPAYLKEPEKLICPIGALAQQQGRFLEQGVFTLNRRNYPVTYRLMWLTADSARQVKHFGEHAPLVVCSSHYEYLFQELHNRRPLLKELDPDPRAALARLTPAASDLAVRRSGEVVALAPDED